MYYRDSELPRIKKLWLIMFLLNSYVFGYENMNEQQLPETKNSTLKPTPQTMIYCNQTDSCRDSDTADDQCDNLQSRSCMCDKQCSIYDDCCADSEFKNLGKRDEKFSCIGTPHDGYIYMVYRCPLHYKNSEIVRNCETTNKTDLTSDALLHTPVTNEITNITFKNVFCAFCNEQEQFEFWNIVLHYKLTNKQNVKIIPQSFPFVQVSSQITADLMLLNLRTSEKNRTRLISEIHGSQYECYLKIKMPNRVSRTKRYCRLKTQPIYQRETFLTRDSTEITSNTFEINSNNSFLPKMNHCNAQFANGAYKILCSPSANLFTKKGRNSEHCFFNTFDGRACLLNVWLKKQRDFYYVDNETIFVNKYNSKFNINEWVSRIDDENEIFLCGTEIPISDERKFYSKANYLLTNVLVKFSILFLIVHLIWSANDNKLHSLPNKIMYSYSSTLLVVYIFWDLEERLSSCQTLAVLLHYTSLSCFAWLLIASYDCWLVICHSSAKFQTFAGKNRLKRYLFYCFWGWISPISIVAIALYFELASASKVPCYLKPGYGRLRQCFVAQEIPLNYFYHYPTAVITCINISLFLHTSYHIFKNKRKDITSTIQNNNSYFIFVRLSLNMGIVAFMVLLWALYILVIKTDFVLFHTIQNIFQAAQGIFMFLLFSLDKNLMKKFIK